MALLRFDTLPSLVPAKRTKEGFLRVEGYATRAGIFTYVLADGTKRRELRHPDDVFKADSLETLNLAPVTLLHPQEGLLTPDTAHMRAVGATAAPVKVQDWVKVQIKVTDAEAIQAIEEGTQALSCGYELDHLDETPGVWNGQPYDARQIGITYNHLALVPAGRAGEQAKLRIDHLDGSAQSCQEDAVSDCPEREAKVLKKIRIDGTEFEVDEALAAVIEKLSARLDAATEEVATFKAQAQAQAQAAALAALEAFKTAAKAAAGEDPVISARIDAASDEVSVKKLVLAKLAPKLDLTGKSDEYVSARYDVALEADVAESHQALAAVSTPAVRADAQPAEDDSLEALIAKNRKQALNAWKTVKGA